MGVKTRWKQHGWKRPRKLESEVAVFDGFDCWGEGVGGWKRGRQILIIPLFSVSWFEVVIWFPALDDMDQFKRKWED